MALSTDASKLEEGSGVPCGCRELPGPRHFLCILPCHAPRFALAAPLARAAGDPILASGPGVALGQQLLAGAALPRPRGARRFPQRGAGSGSAGPLAAGSAAPKAALTSPPVAIAGQTVALTKTTSVTGRDGGAGAAPAADMRPLDTASTADALLGRGPSTVQPAASSGPPTGTSWLGITAASAATKPPAGYEPPDQGLCAGNGYVVELVGGRVGAKWWGGVVPGPRAQ
jgi:hypothetical protein